VVEPHPLLRIESCRQRNQLSSSVIYASCPGSQRRVRLYSIPLSYFQPRHIVSLYENCHYFSFLVWYREVLPLDGPPSFRGQILKYAYKLTVGTQRIHSHIRLLHVPIKVLVLQGKVKSKEATFILIPEPSLTRMFAFTEFAEAAILNGSEELAPANPFLSDQEKESYSDTAFQILQVVTSQRNQKFYNVTNQRGHVVKFCVFKQAYKLGEDIVGSLDFSESTVPCIQYAVSLQSMEDLTPEYRAEKQRNVVATYSKFHEMVIGYQQSHFVIPVPLHVTPSFHTDHIHLKWKLHFEFVISNSSFTELGLMPSETPDAGTMDGKYWQAPSSVNIETMVWDLPIKLYPNLPSYLSQGLQMVTQYKQRI